MNSLILYGECQFGIKGDYYSANWMVGINAILFETPKGRLILGPKIGLTVGSINMGKIEVIEGYNPPVILYYGIFCPWPLKSLYKQFPMPFVKRHGRQLNLTWINCKLFSEELTCYVPLFSHGYCADDCLQCGRKYSGNKLLPRTPVIRKADVQSPAP